MVEQLRGLSEFRIAFPLNRSTSQLLNQKKPGGKNEFSSRVKVGIMTPKDSEVVIERWALMPLSFR